MYMTYNICTYTYMNIRIITSSVGNLVIMAILFVNTFAFKSQCNANPKTILETISLIRKKVLSFIKEIYRLYNFVL